MSSRNNQTQDQKVKKKASKGIKYKNIEKIYNNESEIKSSVIALESVKEEFENGQFISVVGPSGCGKSTLLEITHGLTQPTAGEVYVDGDLVKPPREEEELNRAMVFQDASLLPWRTVKENVMYGMKNIGQSGLEDSTIEETAQHYLQMVGLSGFEESYPHELSGGMQQRVNLARALSLEPSLLLMDEPFSSLDAQTKEIMQEELLDIWKENKSTVLFVTHDLEEAVFLSDQILVLGTDPGRVIDLVSIDTDRPRDRSIRATEEFNDIVDNLWKKLESEVMKTISTDR